jgi:hypothetical protein
VIAELVCEIKKRRDDVAGGFRVRRAPAGFEEISARDAPVACRILGGGEPLSGGFELIPVGQRGFDVPVPAGDLLPEQLRVLNLPGAAVSNAPERPP